MKKEGNKYEKCSYCGEIHDRDRMYWIISEKANCCFKCLGFLDIAEEMKEIIKNLNPELKRLETLIYEIVNLENYIDFTRFINVSKEIEELNIKLRTLYYAMQLTEQ